MESLFIRFLMAKTELRLELPLFLASHRKDLKVCGTFWIYGFNEKRCEHAWISSIITTIRPFWIHETKNVASMHRKVP